MKNFTFIFGFLILLFQLGCLSSPKDSPATDAPPSPNSNGPNFLIAPGGREESKQDKNSKNTFELSYGETKLQAKVDQEGNTTILNYPSEWLANAKLARYDGPARTNAPFSAEHCQEIKDAAKSGFGRNIVRTGFHSLLKFELPIFLSFDFVSALSEAAKIAGLDFPLHTIKNPVASFNGRAEISYSEHAISQILGNPEHLSEKLNIGKKGMHKDPLEIGLIAFSGDIICDLISGAATLTMVYPILEDNREIKIRYRPMLIDLVDNPQNI